MRIQSTIHHNAADQAPRQTYIVHSSAKDVRGLSRPRTVTMTCSSRPPSRGNWTTWRHCGLLLLAVLCSAHGRLVSQTRELDVRVGRSVYLSRDDLHIGSTRRGEDCRVEVVMADPITQRVGHMDPPVSLSDTTLAVCRSLGWLAGGLSGGLHFVPGD